MSTPLISIIVPIYNVEKYLERCLTSLLNQTYNNYEIICINDGSQDNCDKILANYQKQYANIRVIKQENKGLSVARNNGLKNACGEYILFIDSDDTIHPQTLETLYYFIEKNNADIVSFKLKKCSQDNIVYDKFTIQDIDNKVITNPIKNINQKKYKIYYNVCTKIYNRKILDGIEFIPNIHYEDYPHTYAVLSKSPKIVAIDKELYFYYLNNTSISHQKSNIKQIKDYMKGVLYIYEFYKNRQELKYIKNSLLPNLLKQQLKKCEKANFENKDKMYKAFAEELRELQSKNLLKWYYHKPIYYCLYRYIIKKYLEVL